MINLRTGGPFAQRGATIQQEKIHFETFGQANEPEAVSQDERGYSEVLGQLDQLGAVAQVELEFDLQARRQGGERLTGE